MIPVIDYLVMHNIICYIEAGGMKVLFVLSGPSYVGKKTAIGHFVHLYAFSSIIPYTTKNKSQGETEGIQYHYVKEDYINYRKDDFIADTPFKNDSSIYAYKRSDLENAIKSHANFIIHASVNNVKQINELYKKMIMQMIIYFFFSWIMKIH